MEPALLLVLVVAAAAGFAWLNGFHDASNAVATSLATRALTPRVALTLAAALNVIGGLFGVSVAQTLQGSLLEVPVAQPGVGLVLVALLAAIAWNLGTWWFGMPSSSSHALLGGMAGAGLVAGARIDWGLMQERVLVPMLVAPLVGFFAAWGAYAWFARNQIASRHSLLSATNYYRRVWLQQATLREPRVLDGIITQNLSSTPSFFSSTTIIIIASIALPIPA